MKTIVILSSILIMVSCATGQVAEPERFDSYDTAVVTVMTRLPDAANEAVSLSHILVNDLESAAVFREVAVQPPDQTADAMGIDVAIVFVNNQSDAQRLALGQVGRSDEVRVKVSLNDYRTGETLSTFDLRGVSPDRTGFDTEWPWGSVEMALEEVSDKLVNRLVEWRTDS